MMLRNWHETQKTLYVASVQLSVQTHMYNIEDIDPLSNDYSYSD